MICKWCGKAEACDCAADSGMQMAVAAQQHYTNSKIQHMQFAQENGLGWCEGNVTKYITRYKYKNGIEDLRKAASYLKALIQYTETGTWKNPDQLEKEGYKL